MYVCMALIVNQQTNLKHFCRICKKGFGCGRALGGHMRAHGIGDESGHLDDEDQASDWEDDKLGSNSATNNVPPTNKRMYALRTNPNRLKSCRVCENCGKEFLSWKSFLEHGKCSSDDAESLISSPGSDHDHDHDHDITRTQGCTGWSKRKRSFRACKIGNNNNNNLISTITTTTSYCPCSEEEDLANCLMMLSNATVNPDLLVVEPEESCASASKDQDQERRNNINNYYSNPKSFINPSNSCRFQMNNNDNNNYKAKVVANKGLFECKACKKVFNSHQALGGHRASHKKVKGCFAARLDHHNHDSIADDDVITHEEFFPTKLNSISLQQFQEGRSNDNVPTTLVGSSSNKKKLSKVHECSICHRIFSSGQALGGHKRCHWITSNAPDTSTLAKFHQFQESLDQMNMNQRAPNSSKFENNLEPLDLKLDLNLPAPPPVVVHPNVLNPTTFQVSTEIYLQPWISGNKDQAQEDNHYRQRTRPQNNDENDKNNLHIQNNNDNNNNSNGSMQNLDDEADSNKVKKLAKLSELKDITMSEGSSHWLQVGIGTSTDVRPDP